VSSLRRIRSEGGLEGASLVDNVPLTNPISATRMREEDRREQSGVADAMRHGGDGHPIRARIEELDPAALPQVK
jgi:hypothetical protein